MLAEGMGQSGIRWRGWGIRNPETGIRKRESGINNQPGSFRIFRSLPGFCTVLGRWRVWCWNSAWMFLDVGILVLQELPDLDVPFPVVFITDYEPGVMQVFQQSVDVACVVRQRLGLDLPRLVLEPALAIGETPERLEQQTA